MRHDDLTVSGFQPLFMRLTRAHQRQIPAADLDGTIEVYFDVVRRFSESIVAQAVEQLVREPSRFFPKAGEIYAVCKQLEGERDRRIGHQYHDDNGTCPSCRQSLRVAGYERPDGTIIGRVRCSCIPPGQGWFTPAASTWRERVAPDREAVRSMLGDKSHAPRTERIDDIRKQFRRAVAAPIDAGDAWEPEAVEV